MATHFSIISVTILSLQKYVFDLVILENVCNTMLSSTVFDVLYKHAKKADFKTHMHTELKCSQTHEMAQMLKKASKRSAWYSLYNFDGYLYLLFPQTLVQKP